MIEYSDQKHTMDAHVNTHTLPTALERLRGAAQRTGSIMFTFVSDFSHVNKGRQADTLGPV